MGGRGMPGLGKSLAWEEVLFVEAYWWKVERDADGIL